MDVKRMRGSRKNKKHDSNKSKTENNEKANQDVDWTNTDKKTLLEALKKYGSKNITAISNMLPHMSSENIKLKISEYSKIANDLYEHELLNNWLNCGLYKPGDSLIPEALLFIHLFENHPPTSEADGYDFRAIYKFLYHSCFEQPSQFDLSEKDLNLLNYTLCKVENKVWPKYQKEILEYVGRIYNRRNIKNVYPGKNTHYL